jgi:hypothetical protein
MIMRGPTLALGVFALFNACSFMQPDSSPPPSCDAGPSPGWGTWNWGDGGLYGNGCNPFASPEAGADGDGTPDASAGDGSVDVAVESATGQDGSVEAEGIDARADVAVEGSIVDDAGGDGGGD